MLRHTLAITIVSLALSGVVVSQRDPAQSPASVPQPKKEDWREHLRNATVSLGTVAHDTGINRDYFSAVGTGVIVSSDEHTGYLVSARHVFCDPTRRPLWHPRSLNIRFAWQDHQSIYEVTGTSIVLQNESGDNTWFALDDDSDLAAIPFLAVHNQIPERDRRSNYDSVNLADGDPYEGESIFVLGYPGIAGNDRLVRPILRQGIVAWTDPRHPEDSPFLVDANIFPGNSGGPVIELPIGMMRDGSYNFSSGGDLTLLGVVSQAGEQDISTVISGPGVPRIEARTPIVGIGALGVIEPASKVRRLLAGIKDGKVHTAACAAWTPSTH